MCIRDRSNVNSTLTPQTPKVHPTFILQDHNKRQPCERYRFVQSKRMFKEHVCLCDNNVLNLPNRREVAAGNKSVMSVHCYTGNTFNRNKSLVVGKVGETIEKRPHSKEDIRRMLIKKFSNFYERKISTSSLKNTMNKRSASTNSAKLLNLSIIPS
eukprot:TRINITY_DN4808_c0_g1_i9.p1 TRINITY_DN4808_c0_g1~~TRINITY_DN4808_c0_g1_i9.p1  ORF type:complete len:156 (+),score=16.70 TRINITY_DN4808_c0_g1_i9:77-544(+)